MDTYQQMFDQQIAVGMAKAGGIGLAPFIEQQLQKGEASPAKRTAPFEITTDSILQRRGLEIRKR
jgi:Rod binding domain-containing protein